MIDQITKWLFFLSIFAACIAGAFGFGLTVGHYQIWPNAEIRNLQNNLISLIRFQEFVPDGRRMAAPVRAKAERHFILNPKAAQQDGYFAMLGWSDRASRYQVWLYGADGELAHSWPIDDLALSDVAKSRSNAPHALRVLKDGSVIFNFDRLGELHRLGACGEAIWSISKAYHHSLAPSQDGTLWTWAGREEVGDDYQYMVRIDPETGQERERIGLIEQVFEQSAAQATALSLQSGFPIATNSDDALDRFHPNDVEELLPTMAGAFPQFAAGDLLVSLRNLNMVAVIGRSGESSGQLMALGINNMIRTLMPTVQFRSLTTTEVEGPQGSSQLYRMRPSLCRSHTPHRSLRQISEVSTSAFPTGPY